MRCAVLRSPRPACLLLKADCDPLLLLLSTLSIDHLPRPAAGALHQWLLLLLLQEGGVLGADRALQRLRCQRAHYHGAPRAGRLAAQWAQGGGARWGGGVGGGSEGSRWLEEWEGVSVQRGYDLWSLLPLAPHPTLLLLPACPPVRLMRRASRPCWCVSAALDRQRHLCRHLRHLGAQQRDQPGQRLHRAQGRARLPVSELQRRRSERGRGRGGERRGREQARAVGRGVAAAGRT